MVVQEKQACFSTSLYDREESLLFLPSTFISKNLVAARFSVNCPLYLSFAIFPFEDSSSAAALAFSYLPSAHALSPLIMVVQEKQACFSTSLYDREESLLFLPSTFISKNLVAARFSVNCPLYLSFAVFPFEDSSSAAALAFSYLPSAHALSPLIMVVQEKQACFSTSLYDREESLLFLPSTFISKNLVAARFSVNCPLYLSFAVFPFEDSSSAAALAFSYLPSAHALSPLIMVVQEKQACFSTSLYDREESLLFLPSTFISKNLVAARFSVNCPLYLSFAVFPFEDSSSAAALAFSYLPSAHALSPLIMVVQEKQACFSTSLYDREESLLFLPSTFISKNLVAARFSVNCPLYLSFAVFPFEDSSSAAALAFSYLPSAHALSPLIMVVQEKQACFSTSLYDREESLLFLPSTFISKNLVAARFSVNCPLYLSFAVFPFEDSSSAANFLLSAPYFLTISSCKVNKTKFIRSMMRFCILKKRRIIKINIVFYDNNKLIAIKIKPFLIFC